MNRSDFGRVVGGMLLVAGCCIGAGMLALPVLTGLAGFFPSLILFFTSWLFMTFTALLLVEVNGWFSSRVNIVTMAGRALGKSGKIISWVLYLFLFYSLLVAYIAGSGSILSFFGISHFFASILFVLLCGGVVYFGTTHVDIFNRLLMVGLIMAYLGMIFLGVDKIKPKLLYYTDFKYSLAALPVLVVSFGFHNIIPSLTAYMKGNLKEVRVSILGGSLIALIVYLFFEVLTLGIVPVEGKYGLLESLHAGREISFALDHYISSPFLAVFVHSFAFFAIITSFLAQALGLVHFVADGFKLKKVDKNLGLCTLVLIPPLLFALSYPTIFYRALDFAGSFCAVVLFGLLPAAMVWSGRYNKKIETTYSTCGGKFALVVVILFSLFIMFGNVLFKN